MANRLLGQLMRELGDADDLVAVARGLPGNVTTEMDLAVGDLADIARRSSDLVHHLRCSDAGTALTTARTIPGGGDFMAAWDRFIACYGMRGPSEIDISRPGWAEAPRSLLQMVIANLQNSTSGAHRAKQAQLAAAGEAAGERLITAARRGPGGPLRAALVRRLVRVARNLAPIREHPKYAIMRLRGLVRAVILDNAARLHAQDRLDVLDDVWFLDRNELTAALADPTQTIRERIALRKADLARYRHMTPPRVITSDGEIPSLDMTRNDLPAGALAGTPVSAGVVEGRAKVVLDPQHDLLGPGEILIAPFTDPGWTPLFINAAGLVTEVGGLMTHGSVVAREYGIPAVVSVSDATKKIKTGQRIRVHGDKGYVELLDGI